MINFFKFDQGTDHRCDRCENSVKERSCLITLIRCKMHDELNLNEDYRAMRPNDCEDWKKKGGAR